MNLSNNASDVFSEFKKVYVIRIFYELPDGPRVYLRAISRHGCSPDTHISHLCSFFSNGSREASPVPWGEKGTRLEIFLVSHHRFGCDSFPVRMNEQWICCKTCALLGLISAGLGLISVVNNCRVVMEAHPCKALQGVRSEQDPFPMLGKQSVQRKDKASPCWREINTENGRTQS